MIGLNVILDGDNAWSDLKDKEIIHLKDGYEMQVAVLPGGMQSGLPSVAMRFDLPDGQTVVCETSWRLLFTACKAIEARYGEGV